MSTLDKLTFSKDQQQSLLGYALGDAKVYEQCVVAGVSDTWFFDGHQQRIWLELTAFHERHGRHPSKAELCEAIKDDTKTHERLVIEIGGALFSRANLGLDTLLAQLKEWAKATAMQRDLAKFATEYNKGDVEKAEELLGDLTLRLEQINTLSGDVNRMESSAVRAKVERTDRESDKAKVLKYGVGFLDDATGGIAPKDVVVIGAKAGVGKTQLVSQIARSNAEAGKKVAVFALEAENHEIERRIKFQLLSTQYRKDHENERIPFGKINYADWRLGNLQAELGPYEDAVTRYMELKFKGLQTYYRNNGDFGIKELEKRITAVAASVDLIILDHLHYVDTDGNDENAEVKAIVKKIRDLALCFNKPIVVVAHLRKTFGGKHAPLTPGLEDFHGTSDIVKIATTAIILAPAYDLTCADPRADVQRSWKTYIRLVKFRLDGSRARYVAVAFFDPHSNAYLRSYALGELRNAETNWEPTPQEKKPSWAEFGDVPVLASTG